MNNLIKLSKEVCPKDKEAITDRPGTSLLIVVAYDPDSRSIDQVISIDSLKHNGKVFTDITEIMLSQFEEETMAMVNKLEWDELYSEHKHDEREYEAEDCMGRTVTSLDNCLAKMHKIQ